jgi:nicotinamide mononucleotide adenylyltransferase
MDYINYAIYSLKRASDLAQPWTLTPTEAGALVAEFERIKKAFNAADTLCVEIGYALEGKDVPKDKDELLDRVVELRNTRRLDNEALTHAWDESRDMERAAVVAWLRTVAPNAPTRRGADELAWCANAIERGEHRREEKA